MHSATPRQVSCAINFFVLHPVPRSSLACVCLAHRARCSRFDSCSRLRAVEAPDTTKDRLKSVWPLESFLFHELRLYFNPVTITNI